MYPRLFGLAAFLALGAGVLSAGTFTNGGFETNTAGCTGGAGNLGLGSTCITGWVVTTGNIDYLFNFWQNQEGSYSLDLNGNTTGGIAQTFDTNVGDNYTVGFYLAGNPLGTPTVKNLNVVAASASQNYTFDTTSTNTSSMGWTLETLNFTATGTSTTLAFTSLDAGAAGSALDAVTVTDNGPGGAAPEPASAILLLAGLGALAAWRRAASKAA